MSAFGPLPVFPPPYHPDAVALSLCHTPHRGFRKTDDVDNGYFAASLPLCIQSARPLRGAGVWTHDSCRFYRTRCAALALLTLTMSASAAQYYPYLSVMD